MLISLILLVMIAAGGMALTYLIIDDESLMWRLSAGTVIGSAIMGTLVFAIASITGLTIVSASACLLLTVAPSALLLRGEIKQKFRRDRQRAGGKLQGANTAKFLRFFYYAFFFIIFWLFFEKAYFELADGIYTGGSQNLGDLPFHLGAIFSFTEGNNFPPQNPSWAGAKFAYPFVSDLLTAVFMTFGADLKNSMFAQNVAWAFSLFVLIGRFTVNLTNSKLAGRIAPVLLFLSGGLGFLWFFKDLGDSGKPFFDLIWQLPRDYTIGDQFRWGNTMVVLFLTQRSLLLGMPLTIIVLGFLWRVFASKVRESHDSANVVRQYSTPVIIGLLAGMLPLIHLHSLAALFVITGVLFAIQPAKWREWIAFGIGVTIVAIPELAWSLSGTASDTGRFFDWHFGWDKRDTNVFWFWLKNTGIFIPLIAVGIYLYLSGKWTGDTGKDRAVSIPDGKLLLLFYIPFLLLFVIANVAKLAPWEWDNIKILIYWFLGSIPLVALALARLWEWGGVGRIGTSIALLLLIASGSLDVWRTVSGQIKYRVFDSDGVAIAQYIKRKVAPRALILNAPTYNSPIVLTGRQSLMRYSGHLSSHGIDYLPRENDVKRIYEGGGVAPMLLEKYGIEYVLVSPEEKNSLKANEDFFRKFPVAAEVGPYRLYKVK